VPHRSRRAAQCHGDGTHTWVNAAGDARAGHHRTAGSVRRGVAVVPASSSAGRCFSRSGGRPWP
jgi:hypothetical protein